ncbi:MAG: efflux RND transporter periplasmic adaptor subunit [Bacteroidales bacterium]
MKAFNIQHIFFVILGLALASCNTTATNNEAKGPVQVRVEQTAIQEVEQTLDFTGVVQPFEEAHIAPAVPGRIDRILVDVGDKVSKGQLLVNMDRTQLFQAQVQLDNLEKELARMDTLLQAGAVTQQGYDQLKTQVDVARSNIRNLATHTEIRSPLNGVITGRYFSEGEMFSMTPGPAGKPAIVSVNQIRPVKVTIGVSERFLPQVTIGQEALVTTDVFPGQEFEGKVSKIYPTIDRASGTFKVEVVTPNQDELLSPGIFARVALDLEQQQALLVPALAVLKQTGSNERFVFVIEDNTAQRVTVQIGKNFNQYQEIISGLKPGQTLVVTGQHNLIQGAEVEVVE